MDNSLVANPKDCQKGKLKIRQSYEPLEPRFDLISVCASFIVDLC